MGNSSSTGCDNDFRLFRINFTFTTTEHWTLLLLMCNFSLILFSFPFSWFYLIQKLSLKNKIYLCKILQIIIIKSNVLFCVWKRATSLCRVKLWKKYLNVQHERREGEVVSFTGKEKLTNQFSWLRYNNSTYKRLIQLCKFDKN